MVPNPSKKTSMYGHKIKVLCIKLCTDIQGQATTICLSVLILSHI